ncbi:hypothetical protein [Actinomadura decatromicini]|uniref:hypothetical protein n=1 Tax=Actinomadura decatromicini TaxID=2604572 RepID=UPI001653186A|nr:hypothetical protein [Actinomadura decatromicini]
MRLSSKVPPAGYTRAGPRPPRRRPPLRTAVAAAVAAVLGAGLLAAVLVTVHGAAGRPAPVRPAAPDAVTPSSAPAPPPAPKGGEVEPGRASVKPKPTESAKPRRTRAAPPRKRRAVHRRPRSRPSKRPKARPRPGVPPWVRSECARRFPDDPRRRAACVAVLGGRFGGR